MSRCPACVADVEGMWTRCPLCGTAVTGEQTASPWPVVPLRFSRRRLVRLLLFVSLAVVLLSLAAQLLFARGLGGIGAIRSVWLGVITMWVVVLMAVRKRRNVAKGTVYLVVLVDAICVYWDYLTGWRGWSLDYAAPIVNTSCVVALLITVRALRTEVGEHILYSGLTVLLGLAPFGFLALGWVGNPLPSVICAALSFVALMVMQARRGADVRHELAKRLHL